MLPSLTSQFSARRIAAAVAAALFAAAIVVQFERTPRAASSADVAGAAMMRMLSDEHAAIADYLQQEAAARTQADQSAASDLDRMKLAALEEARPAGLRLAQTPVREDKAKASIVRTVAKSEPARAIQVAQNQVSQNQAASGEPMQLLPATGIRPEPSPANGIVRGRLRQLASTVERIPSWFNAAAGWVVEAVPVPSMPSLPPLPMRHFRV